jgi:hypothetical protein
LLINTRLSDLNFVKNFVRFGLRKFNPYLKTKIMEQTNTTPQGKGMAVTGFVLSLVAIVGWVIVSGIAVIAAAATGGGMGLAATWLVLSLASAVLSVMGMMKLGKTGGKKGLAITGMIIGIIATILSVTTVMGVSKAQEANTEFKEKLGPEFQDAMKQLGDSLNTVQ